MDAYIADAKKEKACASVSIWVGPGDRVNLEDVHNDVLAWLKKFFNRAFKEGEEQLEWTVPEVSFQHMEQQSNAQPLSQLLLDLWRSFAHSICSLFAFISFCSELCDRCRESLLLLHGQEGDRRARTSTAQKPLAEEGNLVAETTQ